MTDETVSSDPFYILGEGALSADPPRRSAGPIAWARRHLFADPLSVVLSIAGIAFVAWALPGVVRYLVTDAVWSAPDGLACRAPEAGACWAFVGAKFPYFMYGSYPLLERWRVNVCLLIGAVLIVWLLWTGVPRRNVAAGLFFLVYPIVSFILLYGWERVGLPVVETNLWGGIFVSLLTALVGIVFSLPAGVLLALGRRSTMPIMRSFCVGYIELVRGVPFITVLFMANTMLPLFVPDAWSPDRLLRPLIATALFAAAYMAEVIRGGLQAMPKGQTEGAQSLGLSYYKTMRLVILPQALTLVIPGIVNTFIGLFKDTSLVAIVGIFDFLKTVDAAKIDPAWAGPKVGTSAYVFAALFYWAFCFSMSRYSLYTERRLNAGRRR